MKTLTIYGLSDGDLELIKKLIADNFFTSPDMGVSEEEEF